MSNIQKTDTRNGWVLQAQSGTGFLDVTDVLEQQPKLIDDLTRAIMFSEYKYALNYARIKTRNGRRFGAENIEYNIRYVEITVTLFWTQ